MVATCQDTPCARSAPFRQVISIKLELVSFSTNLRESLTLSSRRANIL